MEMSSDCDSNEVRSRPEADGCEFSFSSTCSISGAAEPAEIILSSPIGSRTDALKIA
jgi:hypothetical protein